MRLLILTHRRADPSFRVRWERFLPALGECDVREIPDGDRTPIFRAARDFDAVVLHRRLLAWTDFRRLRAAARRLVYDFDDALCYRPEPPFRSRGRASRFFRTVARADAVLAGNRNLAALARLRSRRVHVLPSTVEPDDYPPAAEKLPEFTAVWIGQRATLPHLEAAPLAGVRLRVVADAAPPGAGHVPWSLDAEARALAECHAGIMPLPANPFTRGKCGYKILQYYAARLPVVASPVGVNRTLAAGGALLARTPEEWAAALARLRDDPALRDRLGGKGRKFVERRYAAGALAERLRRLLQELTAG